MTDRIYCVYKTAYSGDKLPPKSSTSTITPRFYIGSSTVARINDGYRGSVLSKQYRQVWKEELKQNPQCFTVEIISLWATQEQAIEEELRLQHQEDVVRNPLYVNKSFAVKEGFYGMSVAGESNPNFGKRKDTHPSVERAAKALSQNLYERKLARLMQEALKPEKTKREGKYPCVAEYNERQNRVPKKLRLEIVVKRDSGFSFPEIQDWLSSVGIKVAITSLPRLYDKEKIALLRAQINSKTDTSYGDQNDTSYIAN